MGFSLFAFYEDLRIKGVVSIRFVERRSRSGVFVAIERGCFPHVPRVENVRLLHGLINQVRHLHVDRPPFLPQRLSCLATSIDYELQGTRIAGIKMILIV